MTPIKLFFTGAALACALHASGQTGAYNEQAEAYISKYKAWAIEEQQRTGVPAAITLAQGIHETQAGNSELATEANNHFGIKCKKSWTGATYAHTDDAPNECFRKYASAYDSYKDHSDYLRQTPRYVHCFEQPVTDYAGWARELKAAGYATNPKYAQKLVRIVEDFRLQDYTYEAMKAPQPQGEGLGRLTEPMRAREQAAERPAEVVPEQDRPAQPPQQPVAKEEARTTEVAAPVTAAEETPTEPTPVYGGLSMRNDLKGFYARKGDVLLEAAIKYNMRYAKLLELNDLPDAPLEADMFIYTERKRSTGIRQKHLVSDGETMLQIAQAEGIQLKPLRALNNMVEGDEPVTGVLLDLQVQHNEKPALRSRGAAGQAAYRPQAASREEPEMIATGNQATRPVQAHSPADEPEAETEEPAAAIPDQPARAVAQVKPQTAEVPREAMEMPVTKPTAQPVKPAVTRTQIPAPPRQKTYTIADEPAVGEEPAKYSPRYKPQETVATNSIPVAETSEKQEPVKEEPQDDFSRLKARLDKAVYAPAKANAAPRPQASETAVAAPAKEPVAASRPAAATSGSSYHIVRSGETAYSIARENNLTMKQLMEMNNLNFEAIKVGQKLRVK